MADGEKRIQLGVSPNPFPAYEAGGPVHAGIEGTLVATDAPYNRNDINLRLEVYNDKGESQEVSKMVFNVGDGEARYFFLVFGADFYLGGAKVRLKSASFAPAEDRSQDVYASTSRFN